MERPAEDKWVRGELLQQQERVSAKSRLGSRVEVEKVETLEKRFEPEQEEKEEG